MEKTMSKVEINNEIVLMRPIVRKARVCVVNKLTKEIAKLRKRYGDEKQKEKYKKKADRLVNEIMTLKTIKNDDISKFGISNTKSWNEILTDQSLDVKDRVMARVSLFKTLNERIQEFKKKFSDYEKYLVPGEKKSKRKNKTKGKNNNVKLDVESAKGEKDVDEINVVTHDSEPGSILKIKSENDETKTVSPVRREQKNSTLCENNTTQDSIKKNSTTKRKRKTSTIQLDNEENASSMNHNIENDRTSFKITNEEAVVKRLTDFLEHGQEQIDKDDENICKIQQNCQITNSSEPKEEIDDFFTYTDGNAYRRVVADPNEGIKDSEENVYNERPQGSKRRVENHFTNLNKKSHSNEKFQRNTKNNSVFDQTQKRYRKEEVRRTKPFEKQQKKQNHLPKDNFEQNLDDENLHPSWMAKKKQQDMLKQGFQGKKVVFDD